MAITSIADRLTPSVPIEVTYGAQLAATGRKVTTIFAHRAASGGSLADYTPQDIVNVGDPVAVKSEVEGYAGAGSQAAIMAVAFVNANALAGRSSYPAFRIVLLPSAELHFGPAAEAITACLLLRSDMFVSPYAASDTTNKTTIENLCILLTGPDRDLNGQFGSFYTLGSLDAYNTAAAYNYNSRYGLIAWLQDTNTADVPGIAADTVSGSNTLANIASTAGIYPGAVVTGTGVPVGSVVQQVFKNSVIISANASATGTAVVFDFQNMLSQPHYVVAAAHAAGVMSSVFPYNPLQNVQVGGLIPPQKNSDKVVFNPNGLSETALIAGLSPLASNADGTVRFVRTRTSWVTLPGNVPKNAYFDWQDIVLLYDFREVCYNIAQNPPFNNNPGGTKASQTTAALFKDEVLRAAQNFEDQGAFQGVQTLSKLFIVQPSTTSRGRFDFKIPVNVIPGLYVIAGNIEASVVGDFTL